MIIRSVFKDYYDAGIAYGVDTNLLYLRDNFKLYFEPQSYIIDRTSTRDKDKQRIIDFKNYIDSNANIKTTQKSYRSIEIVTNGEFSYYINFNVLFIAGKNISYIITEKVKLNDSRFEYKVLENKYIYTIESLNEFLKSIVPSKQDYKNIYSIERVQRIFKEMQEYYANYKKLDFIYEMYNTPMFNLTFTKNYDIEVNPILKEIKFKEYIDPYTCFQNISMFIGYLNNTENKPKNKIEDVYIRDAKGFNSCSFKKRSKKGKTCKS